MKNVFLFLTIQPICNCLIFCLCWYVCGYFTKSLAYMFRIYLSVNVLCHALLVPPFNGIVGREAVWCLSLNKPFVVLVVVLSLTVSEIWRFEI